MADLLIKLELILNSVDTSSNLAKIKRCFKIIGYTGNINSTNAQSKGFKLLWRIANACGSNERCKCFQYIKRKQGFDALSSSTMQRATIPLMETNGLKIYCVVIF